MDLKPVAKRIPINLNQQKNKMIKDLAGEEKDTDRMGGWWGGDGRKSSETGNDKRVGTDEWCALSFSVFKRSGEPSQREERALPKVSLRWLCNIHIKMTFG